jgi:hypothetical protein
MKRTLQLSLWLIAFTSCVPAAEPSADVKKSVLSAEKDWTAAVLKGDRSALDKLTSADLSYTHSSAKTETKEQFIQAVTGGTTTYKSIEFETPRLRQYGSAVVITHSGVFTTVQTGVSHLYITEVWAQEEGRWQMVSRQATKLP